MIEGIKITSNNEADNRAMMVWLWDLGPAKPVAPARPKAPTSKEGSPEHDLEMVEFREAIGEYELALKTYKAAKAELSDFEKRFGGPHEIPQYSVDAADTLARDPARYCISSRTRGYEKLKNRGLPTGVKPGHGQAEQERREQEGEADLVAARRSDPHFAQETRP